jgi:hypothetical protein
MATREEVFQRDLVWRVPPGQRYCILHAVFENLDKNMGNSRAGKCIAENMTISAKGV